MHKKKTEYNIINDICDKEGHNKVILKNRTQNISDIIYVPG